MLSTFGPALPSNVKAIPQLAAPVLGAFGLRQVVYETTGSEEVDNLATDAMMFGLVLQQVNKAINPNQMDDIIKRTSDEALSLVDDVLDDGFKNTVDNIVDDTASQVSSEASALEGGVDDLANSLPDVQYTSKKLQHEFKHADDFGISGNCSKTSGDAYQKVIQNHIDTASDVYKSTYRGQEVNVFINKVTGLGVYTDLLGNYIGGRKFTPEQMNFHIMNGIKIK